MNEKVQGWMAPMIAAVQPFCDEKIVAAHTFQGAGGWAWGIGNGLLFRGLFSRPSRKVRERTGGLPGAVILAIGPTKVFVFAYRTRWMRLEVGPPLRVWHRDDLVVHSDQRLVASKLTIDVKSTGEHHELESTSMTGRLGKMTIEMFRLLGESSRRPVTAGDGALRQRLGELADAIEEELKGLRTWMAHPPAEETVLAGGAFGLRTVPFDAWLQVVFVPRLRAVAAGEMDIPASSSVGAQAVREYDGYGSERDPLMELIYEVDSVVNGYD